MRYFSDDHHWVEVDGMSAVIGISAYAVSEIGEVNYVEAVASGTPLKAGRPLCVIESMKAAADLRSPVSGIVTEFNPALENEPSLLNTSPEKDGWLCKVTLADPSELESLMSEDEYRRRVK